MASEDALLLRSMRSTSGKAAVPFDVPEVEPEVVVGPEDGESLGDLRDRYQELSSTVSRPEYRGFEIPADMGRDRVGDWLAAIDVREDAREAREAEPYLTRTPDPWEGQFLEQMKGLSLEASREEQRFLRDPKARAEVYKDWAGDVYGRVMEGDPETIRNVFDVSSLVDITGGSDLTSAVQSGRLAYREPDRRVSHLTDTAISGLAGTVQGIATVFGAAPLVGTLLSGARLKAAMRGADVAEDVADVAKAVPDAPAPVFESAAEKLAVGLPDKLGVQALEGTLGRKKHQKAGQVAEYTQDVKDKTTGEVIHKKGDKKLSKSGEEIVYPEYTYKDITAGEWGDTKLDEFIETAKASGKKSISKDELIKHLEDNKVQIEEVRLSDNVPIPQEVRDLGVKKIEASRALRSEVESLSGVLAPGENLGTHLHKFEQNPTHFNNLYVGYVSAIRDIRMFENVPSDMSGVVNRLIDLDRNVSVSDWRPEDAARFTEARKAVAAKLADPDYQRMVAQEYNKLDESMTVRTHPDEPQGEFLDQHENLQKIARLLDRMPEAESRLAALRKFENLPKHQEYSSLHRQYKTKLEAATPEIERQRTRWENHTVPGGEDYQEILLTVPSAGSKEDQIRALQTQIRDGRMHGEIDDIDFVLDPNAPEVIAERERVSRLRREIDRAQEPFTGSHHSDIPNVLAHIRFKTRIDSRGRRIMFIEEIQSDWHQAGLKEGYARKVFKVRNRVSGNFGQSFDTKAEAEKYASTFNPRIKQSIEIFEDIDGNIPNAPLKDTKEWTALAIKRIFREAAEQGFDGVAFSRADMITPVVSLGTGDDAIGLIGNPEAFMARLAELKKKGGHYAEGAEQAEKVFKGNQYFYDKLIPSIAKKETKAKQGTTYIELEDVGFSSIRDPEYPTHTPEFFDTPEASGTLESLVKDGRIIEVPFFELTKEVKDKVIKPQKLYSLALPGIAIGAAAAGEEELSAAAALGAIGMGGMALYRGAKGARAAKLEGLTDLKGNAPKLNDDGTITLYHRTTPEAAAEIRRTGKFISKENTDEVFLSSKRTGQAEGYGSEVVEVRVDPDKVRLDDAFDDEIHVAVKTADVAKPPAATDIGRTTVDGVRYKSRTVDAAEMRKDLESQGHSIEELRQQGHSPLQGFEDYEPRVVNIDDIPTGGDFKVRDPERVRRATKFIESGEDMTPPQVGLDADGKIVSISDGVHRIAALRKAGKKQIVVDTYKPPAAATAAAKTDTPEFKTWFGKSKVVDEAGEPLVVYHGTTGDFDVFKNPYAEDVAGGGWHMFADNADYSSQFTFTHGKGSIVPVYLSVKNPLDLTALPARRGDVRVKLIRALRRAGIDPDALDIPYEDDLYKFINRRGFRADLKNAAQEAGYDGIIFKDVHGTIDSTTHVVFDSTQIKSKFNKGTFDPTDPSILKGIGIGAAVPAAAAVRSQRGEEQGNPLPDEPLEEAPYEPYYTGEDYVQSYELSDSREVYQQRTGLKSRFNKLASELALVEAEYYSLPDEERASKRGDVLHEWHNERLDDLSVVGAELDSGEYLRFLRGEDYYYETRPYSLDDFDANRAFDVIDYNGPKIPDDIEMRAAQELGQAGLFESIIDMGGPMVHLSGPNGAMNRFVYNKAQSFNHPVQSVQLNRSDKLALMKDINNVQSLKDAGLISFLLYKELIGDVQLF